VPIRGHLLVPVAARSVLRERAVIDEVVGENFIRDRDITFRPDFLNPLFVHLSHAVLVGHFSSPFTFCRSLWSGPAES
jgi:hypothetical protein